MTNKSTTRYSELNQTSYGSYYEHAVKITGCMIGYNIDPSNIDLNGISTVRSMFFYSCQTNNYIHLECFEPCSNDGIDGYHYCKCKYNFIYYI